MIKFLLFWLFRWSKQTDGNILCVFCVLSRRLYAIWSNTTTFYWIKIQSMFKRISNSLFSKGSAQWGLFSCRLKLFPHCYSHLIYLGQNIHFYLTFLFSRNLDQAIASPLLGLHIVRNYTFNLAPHGHSAACFFCDDRQGQLKIQWIQTESLNAGIAVIDCIWSNSCFSRFTLGNSKNIYFGFLLIILLKFQECVCV